DGDFAEALVAFFPRAFVLPFDARPFQADFTRGLGGGGLLLTSIDGGENSRALVFGQFDDLDGERGIFVDLSDLSVVLIDLNLKLVDLLLARRNLTADSFSQAFVFRRLR